MKDTWQHATFNLVHVSHVNKGHNGLYGDWLIVTKGEKKASKSNIHNFGGNKSKMDVGKKILDQYKYVLSVQ